MSHSSLTAELFRTQNKLLYLHVLAASLMYLKIKVWSDDWAYQEHLISARTKSIERYLTSSITFEVEAFWSFSEVDALRKRALKLSFRALKVNFSRTSTSRQASKSLNFKRHTQRQILLDWCSSCRYQMLFIISIIWSNFYVEIHQACCEYSTWR